jgi:adenylosuccinate synthase
VGGLHRRLRQEIIVPAHTILGAQWGDEGKGKLVDVLAPGYEAVVRFQGGNNAGHTVVVGSETYKFNLLPSGAVQGRRVVIGNGVVVDPRVLVRELEQLASRGRPAKLTISDRAHVIMPYHVALDGARESGAAGGKKIGTTKRGIGPCYSDKVSRQGIRMLDLVDPQRFRARLAEVYPIKAREMAMWKVPDAPSLESILSEYEPLANQLRKYVGDAGALLDRTLRKKGKVLLEGAQGIMLDIDHGTYPYVTSSNIVGASAGAGIGPHEIQACLGVAKAYATRVGEGPFPTELASTEGPGKVMLDVGREFGTVTGRPRRVGWLDLPALRYAVRVGGITHLAIMKLDVLNGLDEIRVATGYDAPDGQSKAFPASEESLASVKPVWRSLPGWAQAATRSTGQWKLSRPAQAYLAFLEKALGIPIVLASVGPARDATVVRKKHPFGKSKSVRR